MTRHVTFGESCRYELPDYHGENVNKLFGLSFGFGGVHHNSARFGWRWSRSQQCIELLAYCYVNGVRNWDEQKRFPVVARVLPSQTVRCEIAAAYEYINGQDVPVYTFMVEGPGIHCLLSVPRVDVPPYGLTCGLYFGGALPAPHDIHVTIGRHGK